jgi:hypothetical protein
MLTIFSTPKPFCGHIAVIQRNAIQSWKRLHPDVDIILVGNEEGTEELTREFNLRHVREAPRNGQGTKFLAPIFDRAAELAQYDLLCYVNCDIVLASDFLAALKRVLCWRQDFLLVGRRWDTNVIASIDFDLPDWEVRLHAQAMQENHQRPPEWIDYFVFPRGLYYRKIPPFVIGRPGWDNWLLWFARKSRMPVVDASHVVLAVHQNHDYSYHPQGEHGVWHGEETNQNYALLTGLRGFRTIDNASYVLTADRIATNHRHWPALGKRVARNLGSQIWFSLLNVTRPLRHRLGLQRDRVSSLTRER